MTTQVKPRVQVQPRRRLFTVDDYHAMVLAGILGEKDRVELIDGEIIVMAPIGDEHIASVDLGNEFLVNALRRRAIVRVQGSIRLGEHNEPQPDLLVLRRRDDFYRSGPAGPGDVLLLIEVSHSSLSYDRNVKLALYARFDIPEFWIANIQARTIEVYTDPVDGEYTTLRTFRPGQTVTPSAFDDIALPVADIIGRNPEPDS